MAGDGREAELTAANALATALAMMVGWDRAGEGREEILTAEDAAAEEEAVGASSTGAGAEICFREHTAHRQMPTHATHDTVMIQERQYRTFREQP